MPQKEMLVNYVPGEECRIAILEDDRLEELYQERASAESHVGNIYKGRVLNVEPAIQAAFIDFGLERNGFLHISDLHPRYFPGPDREEFEQVGSKTPRRERPPIQKCLRRGQEVLVQVLKEGIGTKGPTLTSYLSIPGRLLVMMPHMERLGVSRKVEDDDARRETRNILNELKPPAGFGFIIRTAGVGQTKTELKRDMAYLQRLWKAIELRMKQTRSTGELYTESDLVIRTLRDVFTTDINRVVIDDPSAAKRAKDFLSIVSPRAGSSIVLYNDPVPLFHRFDVERQIETINARMVALPSGGSLVIDSAEALVAIDVNSGKSRDAKDAESNAYQTNVEAVEEIARQLRLRDLGGVVVLDLIDMRSLKHRKDIEQRFRTLLKKDRARTRTTTISTFGLLEMTRQRMRPSLKKSLYAECKHCLGAGHVKSSESVVLDVMRRLALVLQRKNVARVELTISPDVAFQLLNRKRARLVQLEQQHDKQVMVRVNGDRPLDFVDIIAYDARGGIVETDSASAATDEPLNPQTAFVEVTGAGLPPEFDPAPDEAVIDDDAQEEPEERAAALVAPVAPPTRPKTRPAPVAAPSRADESDEDSQGPGEGGQRKRRRRRRRGGQRGDLAPAPAPGDAPGDAPTPGSSGPGSLTAASTAAEAAMSRGDVDASAGPHDSTSGTTGQAIAHHDETSRRNKDSEEVGYAAPALIPNAQALASQADDDQDADDDTDGDTDGPSAGDERNEAEPGNRGDAAAAVSGDPGAPTGKRRRRRRRGGRGRKRPGGGESHANAPFNNGPPRPVQPAAKPSAPPAPPMNRHVIPKPASKPIPKPIPKPITKLILKPGPKPSANANVSRGYSNRGVNPNEST